MQSRLGYFIGFSLGLLACGDSSTGTLPPPPTSPLSDAGTTSEADAGDAAVTEIPDAAAVATSLGGLRWNLPCTTPFNEDNCNTTDPSAVTATLGGASGTYQVTLRFRGVVEGKTYTGGSTEGPFNIGGVPATDGFNLYKMEVSDPPQSYYLNAGTSGVGLCFAIDYTKTIPMAAGATVSLTATAVDGVQHKNLDDTYTPIVVAGIAPAPDAFDGQFIQMDVVSVSGP